MGYLYPIGYNVYLKMGYPPNLIDIFTFYVYSVEHEVFDLSQSFGIPYFRLPWVDGSNISKFWCNHLPRSDFFFHVDLFGKMVLKKFMFQRKK